MEHKFEKDKNGNWVFSKIQPKLTAEDWAEIDKLKKEETKPSLA